MNQIAFWKPGLTALAGLLLTVGAATTSHAQQNDRSNANDVIIGQITRIDQDSVTIRLGTNNQERTFQISNDSQITIDGKKARVRDVRNGETVRVVTSSDSRTAAKLDVVQDDNEQRGTRDNRNPNDRNPNDRNANDRNADDRNANDRNTNDRNNSSARGNDRNSASLGIGMAPSRNDRNAIEVTQIRPNSPAAQAGLHPGDRILKFGGRDVRSIEDVSAQLQERRPGEQVELLVERNGQQQTVKATLAARDQVFGNEEQSYRAFSQESRPWLGIGLEKGDKGVKVTRLYPSGPAARGGLHVGDEITQFNDAKVSTPEELTKALEKLQPGATAKVVVLRGNGEEALQVPVGDSNHFSPPQGGPAGPQHPFAPGIPQGSGPQPSQTQGDEHGFHVPEHAMMLEQQRHMAEQHYRIETMILELRKEIQALRAELKGNANVK